MSLSNVNGKNHIVLPAHLRTCTVITEDNVAESPHLRKVLYNGRKVLKTVISGFTLYPYPPRYEKSSEIRNKKNPRIITHLKHSLVFLDFF